MNLSIVANSNLSKQSGDTIRIMALASGLGKKENNVSLIGLHTNKHLSIDSLQKE